MIRNLHHTNILRYMTIQDTLRLITSFILWQYLSYLGQPNRSTNQLAKCWSSRQTFRRFPAATAKRQTRTPAVWIQSASTACCYTNVTHRFVPLVSAARTSASPNGSTAKWRSSGRCLEAGGCAVCTTSKRWADFECSSWAPTPLNIIHADHT